MGSHTPMPNGRSYHKTTDKRPHHPTEQTEKSFLCCITILVQTLWLVSNKPWLRNLPGASTLGMLRADHCICVPMVVLALNNLTSSTVLINATM